MTNNIACDPKYLHEPLATEKEPVSKFDFFHEVVSGNPKSRVALICAGLFMLQWWAMDADQYLEDKWAKWHPVPVECELRIPSLPSIPLLPQGHIVPAPLYNDNMPIITAPYHHFKDITPR